MANSKRARFEPAPTPIIFNPSTAQEWSWNIDEFVMKARPEEASYIMEMDTLCEGMGIDIKARKELVRIIRGVNGKKRTIYFEGEPDCGKTWMAHTILAIFDKQYDIGVITGQDPKSAFWLGDCVGKKVCYADELLLTMDNINTAKMLFECNNFLKANVKNKASCYLEHEFVIVCSNHNICMAVGGHTGAIEARSLHLRVSKPPKFEMKRSVIERQKYIAAFIDCYM